MPAEVRAAYDRAVDDPAELHSGARLAAKLNAKIIVDGNEFSNAGEMSVDDRHSYHEALEALFPPRHCGIYRRGAREQWQEAVAGHDFDQKLFVPRCPILST